jgi:hypothetical protein
MTIGLLEARETINQVLVSKLIKLFDWYCLKNKSLHMWVKFEYFENYLEIYYEVWSLRFGWKFSKYLFWSRHANLLIFIKRFVKTSNLFPSFTQSNLQEYITWLNFFGKFTHNWTKACANSKLCLRKLNILMKTKVNL